jgi:hypothetical protein
VSTIGLRWTSDGDGDLGLPARTLSVFADGVKGTDATGASSAFSGFANPFYWGVGENQSNMANYLSYTPNAWLGCIVSKPYAPTDGEMAAYV